MTSDATKIRTLIVDDEELARDRMQALLELQPDVEIVGVCSDGVSALETIEKLEPEPDIVFVTAHDGHAIRAFEIHALDFLLKPFDQTRFEKTLDRARGRLRNRHSATIDSHLVSLLEELREERKYPERLIVKSSGRVFFVRTEEIDWVEASGNYVKVHTKTDAHLLRESMKNMEASSIPRSSCGSTVPRSSTSTGSRSSSRGSMASTS
jgi:two-component system LytT family response regulator